MTLCSGLFQLSLGGGTILFFVGMEQSRLL